MSHSRRRATLEEASEPTSTKTAVELTSDTTPVPAVDRAMAMATATPVQRRGRRREIPILTEDDLLVRPSIAELLSKIPTEPGVYLMKDKRNRVIYIGKAKNLRNRVRSYFRRSGDDRPFVKLLDRILSDIETVITSSEKEALLLENNLIKQHKPRFNVRLVDDKNYLVLRIDPTARYPRLEVTRQIRDDGARYFGPYHSARACRQTLEVIGRHFRLRTCTDQVMNSRRRPCLEYQIKRCDAPCVLPVSPTAYAEQVRDVALFLDHKSKELVDSLRDRMQTASEQLEFETAAALRDQLGAIETTLERQHAVATQFVDQDVVGFYREGDVLEFAVLLIREGKLIGRRTFRCTDQEFPDEESVSSFVSQYYDRPGIDIPDEVLLPLDPEDAAAKTEWLRDRSVAIGGRPRKVSLLHPKRGPKQKLVDLAMKNAAAAYASRRNRNTDTHAALQKLQRRLGLKKLPLRIECFDISHWQGTDTVASRVVFLDGEPAKHLYRTFKVRSVENDDFAAMYEVVSRRFRRARELPLPIEPPADTATASPAEEVGFSAATVARRRSAALLPLKTLPSEHADAQVTEDDVLETEDAEVADAQLEAAFGEALADGETHKSAADPWALPDLLVIDGGKGQLASALAALKDVGIPYAQKMDVVALAKEREDVSSEKKPDRVFLPRTKEPIRLRDNTAELFVLSRIRDEAHRFAVSFHEKLREKRTIRSRLEEIPGIGKKRQRALLKALGSVRRIRTATREELAQVKGMSDASVEQVLLFFRDTTTPHCRGASATTLSGNETVSRPVSPKLPSETDVVESAASVELRALGPHDIEEEETLSESVEKLLSSNPEAPAKTGP